MKNIWFQNTCYIINSLRISIALFTWVTSHFGTIGYDPPTRNGKNATVTLRPFCGWSVNSLGLDVIRNAYTFFLVQIGTISFWLTTKYDSKEVYGFCTLKDYDLEILQEKNLNHCGLVPLVMSYAVWGNRSWSTLAHVMAWCLTAPNHYLNQCWLVVKGVLWQSPASNFTSAHELTP